MAEERRFMPYQPMVEPTVQATPVFHQQPYMPESGPWPNTQTPVNYAAPPPKQYGGGKDLLCENCGDPIELGDDHVAVSYRTTVPSRKDQSVAVSEFHQETREIYLHEYCLFGYAVDNDINSGGGQTDALVEQYYGASVIQCVCSNCAEELDSDSIPDLLCQNCESKMR